MQWKKRFYACSLLTVITILSISFILSFVGRFGGSKGLGIAATTRTKTPLASSNNGSDAAKPLPPTPPKESGREAPKVRSNAESNKTEAPGPAPKTGKAASVSERDGLASGAADDGDTATADANLSHKTITIPYVWKRHPFWNNGMSRFCDLIRTHTVDHDANTTTTLLVNFTTKCLKPSKVFGLGTGNIVMAVYGLRLAAASLGVDFCFHCSDVKNGGGGAILRVDGPTTKKLQYSRSYKEEVLPWLQGYFAAPKRRTKEQQREFSPYKPPIPGTGKTCRGFGKCPLHYMSEAIRHDLRKMALTLLGGTEETQTKIRKDQPSSLPPLILNATIDNVAIHFRCGDLLGLKTDTYGFSKFDSYRKHISPHASSIGIVTQSFDPKYNRNRDRGATEPCRIIVEALVRYLEHYFPKATVSIRNGPEETQATSYARLVLTNQTFCGLSTFSVFPTIASFGTSYIQKGRLNYFVPPIEEVYRDVKTMDGPVLTSNMIRKMKSVKKIVNWLVEEKGQK